MKFTGVNFSLSDRINSAKTESSNKNDISAVPSKPDINIGDTNIDTNTSAIDSAGKDVGAQRDSANNATSPEAASEQSKNSSLQYEKPESPEFPKETDPGKERPVPKKKGFMERLLDRQMESMMADTSGRPAGESTNTDNYPKDQGKDINKPLPADNTPQRPNPQGFDPGNINTNSPQAPSGDRLEGLPGDIPGATSGALLGPIYSSPGTYRATTGPIGAPKASRPTMPKLPKFK